MKKVLAFFDFDGTLIKGNSLPKFLWYYMTPFIFIKKTLFSIPVLIIYALNLIDSHSAKQRVIKKFFNGTNEKDFMEKASLFSHSVIPSILREEAIERVKWHQEMKHTCILVSASIETYLLPWAEANGFSKVLATKLEVDHNGKITGKFSGKNCKGVEKIRRIEEYYGDLKQYETYTYGDSEGDKELLRISDHPFLKSFDKERSYSS